MAASGGYRLGSIWLVSFDPSIGTEIRKTRPAVIISGTAFNQRSKVTVLPITSANPSDRLLPVIVPLVPSITNGISSNSFVVCVDPMTFDKHRLIQCLGQVEPNQLEEI
ncbi:MAG: type II toxin-antitoxin system PemK/MazF family toxin [Pseudanabaena sp.]